MARSLPLPLHPSVPRSSLYRKNDYYGEATGKSNGMIKESVRVIKGRNDLNKNVVGCDLNIQILYRLIKTNANDKIPQEMRCLRVALLKSIINIVRHLSKIFGKHMCPVSPTLFATKPGSSPQLKLWGSSTGVTPSYKKEKYNGLCFLRFLHNNFSEIADAAMTLDPTFAQWNPCVEMQKLYTDSRGGLNGPRSCS